MKTPRRKPLSAYRKALFEKYNVPPDRIARLREELRPENLAKLAEAYRRIDPGLHAKDFLLVREAAFGDLEAFGDVALVSLLERQARPDNGEAGFFARAAARDKWADKFFATFGVALRRYWDPWTGLDVVRLDDEVVKSGEQAMLDVVRSRWGDEAAAMVQELVRGIRDGDRAADSVSSEKEGSV